jgi:hypothetical protein
MQPGVRSPWAKQIGGAGKPEPTVFIQCGDRSPLFYWGGGAAKPPMHGDYAGPRSMLAFWIGGANFHYLPSPEPPYYPSDTTGGIPYRKHQREHVRRDDEEIIEFLRIWVTWNDVE